MYTARIITVSDRSFRGQRKDESGPVLQRLLQEAGYDVADPVIVPDEMEEISAALRQAVREDAALVLTTGGTGFAPRDITPEATAQVCTRMTPGIAEAMRAASLKITPHGMLSRGVAGICEGTLIINLPGSPKAALENWEAVSSAVPHGLKMLRGGQADCAAGDK